MFSIAAESKSVKMAVIILMAAMLFACIFASLYYNDKLLLGSFELYDDDDVKYLRSAQTFIKTGQLTYGYPDKPTVFIMPGITLFLSPFVALFGAPGAVMPVRIVFAILQTFNLYMVFFIARKIFNSRVALITMVLSFFYLPNIYVSTVVLTEVPAYTAFLLMIYFLIWGTETKQKRLLFIAGTMWAIAVMFRATMTVLGIVIFIYWLFKKIGIKDMAKFAVCVAIPFVIIMSPWVIRKFEVFDRFIPLTLSSGNPKMQGTIIDYSAEEREKLLAVVNTNDIDYGDSEISADAAEHEIENRLFKYNIKHNTVEYLRWYTVGKTIRNFSLPYMWYPIYLGTYLPITVYHRALLVVFVASVLFMIIQKRINAETGMILVTVLLFNCIHLPYYCFSRYMYMVMCFIIMISAYGFQYMYKQFRHIFIKMKNFVDKTAKSVYNVIN